LIELLILFLMEFSDLFIEMSTFH